MTFVMTYAIRDELMDKAVARVLETGGPAPAGVKMVGRWHAATVSFCWKETTRPPSTGSRLSGTISAISR